MHERVCVRNCLVSYTNLTVACNSFWFFSTTDNNKKKKKKQNKKKIGKHCFKQPRSTIHTTDRRRKKNCYSFANRLNAEWILNICQNKKMNSILSNCYFLSCKYEWIYKKKTTRKRPRRRNTKNMCVQIGGRSCVLYRLVHITTHKPWAIIRPNGSALWTLVHNI